MMESGVYAWMATLVQYSDPTAHSHVCNGHADAQVGTAPAIGGASLREAVGILTAMVWNIVKEKADAWNN